MMTAKFHKGQLVRDDRKSMQVLTVHRDGSLTVRCRFSLDEAGRDVPGTYLGCVHRYGVDGLAPLDDANA